MHDRIGLGCPEFAIRDPKETLEEMNGRIARWEMLAEDRCALPFAVGRLRELLPSYDVALQVHAPFSDLNPASVNPAVKEFTLRTLEGTLEGSRALDVRVVTVHPGVVTPMGSILKGASIENNIESFASLARKADELGLRIALENMPFPAFTLCNDAREMREVLDDAGFPDALGFCLDAGHANITGGTAGLLGLKGRLFNVHLHDNDGRKDQHKAIGDGSVDIASVLRSLLPAYKGPLIIEGKGTDHVCLSQERLEEMLSAIGGWK